MIAWCNSIMQITTPRLDQMIRPRRLAERLGVSTTTLWRMQQRNEIPRPIRISRGAVAWRESTILDYLASRERVA